MIRETYNTENSNTDENLDVKEDGDGCPIALKGLVLAEKNLEDIMKSTKNHFEAFKIEGVERGIEEFKKGMKNELELLKKENALLKEKAASLQKQFNQDSYFGCNWYYTLAHSNEAL